MGAAFHKGSSNQSVGTPLDFIEIVESRFGPFTVDLAASLENAICERFVSEEDDYFKVSLQGVCANGLGWLNPPYSKIGPWVKKLHDELTHGKSNAICLVPASVGANWWRDYVHNKCAVIFLNGRIKFVGHKTPYPKDLALLIYGPISDRLANYSVWNWKKDGYKNTD